MGSHVSRADPLTSTFWVIALSKFDGVACKRVIGDNAHLSTWRYQGGGESTAAGVGQT